MILFAEPWNEKRCLKFLFLIKKRGIVSQKEISRLNQANKSAIHNGLSHSSCPFFFFFK